MEYFLILYIAVSFYHIFKNSSYLRTSLRPVDLFVDAAFTLRLVLCCCRVGQILNLFWEKTTEDMLYTAVCDGMKLLSHENELVDYSSTENVCLAHSKYVVLCPYLLFTSGRCSFLATVTYEVIM